MACLEHACRNCDALWFSNGNEGPCPECGGIDYTTHFDELPEYDYDDDADEPWDGEDV